MSGTRVTMDGNEAATSIAYRTSEVIAIYPITPASPMGELSDAWSARDDKNIWGTTPRVVEMQAEGGAAGAVHGALQTGALTTTFTASQGLLLMIPNMYRIAGELTSGVIHIAARSLAAQALSIFCDHSDVMSVRGTGWGMLFANSVQETADMALVAHAATLEARVPILHIFDGFRTSHELQKIELISDDQIRAMIDEKYVREHRSRALSPDNPFIRGTAHNPDVYFQAREAANPYYDAMPAIIQGRMNRLFELTGRRYDLFDYVGDPDAERVIILMGSGAETAEEAVLRLVDNGESVGILKIRLFRPFSLAHFIQALPESVRSIAVLDRTKEPGSIGEPLYQDVLTAVVESMASADVRFAAMPRIISGRYGLSSKEFTPAMVNRIFEELTVDTPKNHFTIGIQDDVSGTSLDYDTEYTEESPEVTRAVFWGLGSDGTVGANKNSIKIIGESTDFYSQGYFVYDSKKAGARTISHLRFGPKPIHSTYLIRQANFVAVHQFGFLERYDTLDLAQPGGVFLLNSPHGPEEVWDELPRKVQDQIIEKNLSLFIVDAYRIAKKHELGTRINTIMQVAFFALSKILPEKEAFDRIKEYIQKTYGKRGEAVVRKNNAAVDDTLAGLYEVSVPETAEGTIPQRPPVPAEAPEFIQDVTATMIAGRGDELPVSSLPVDGTYPSGTTKWEKRNIALEIPEWDENICIQCGKCVIVCPHAVIRATIASNAELEGAPASFKTAPASWREFPELLYTLQSSPEDCTGCKLCVEVCPAKDKSRVGFKALNMVEQRPILEREIKHWEFFKTLPTVGPGFAGGDGASTDLTFTKIKNVQLRDPLFEFSSACAGCGETPYLRLMTQLFGDRLVIANATGCSSIYGGNLPTTPWSVNKDGRGPAWSNSLFEDNAEFGLGMRLALDKQEEYARELMLRMRTVIGEELTDNILNARQDDDHAIDKQRNRIQTLKKVLTGKDTSEALDLMSLADTLVRKSVWIVGGDGWAYDIGYGGLDHVLASGRNVKVIVLDTEVYSNTGGQASKATGLGAVAKFAAGGKPTPKKDLGLLVMSYGYVYVAQIALGANDNHTIKVMLEAESFDGPSIIIAYSHCIAHGIDMSKGLEQQNLAVKSGYWPLFRFDPRLTKEGKNPFQLDSKKPTILLKDYIYNENRYRILLKTDPEAAGRYLAQSQKLVDERWNRLEVLAQKTADSETAKPTPRGPGIRTEPPGNGKPELVKPGLASLPTGQKPKRKLSPGSE